MKIRRFVFILIMFTVVVFCSVIVCERSSIICALLDSYYGLSIDNDKFTGFTYMMNMVLNFSMLFLGCKNVNDIFKMYNFIAIRCNSKFKLYVKLISSIIRMIVSPAISFMVVNSLALFIVHVKSERFILLSIIYFFISYLIWFCIIEILFTFNIHYSHIFYTLITISILSPVINFLNAPILILLVPFPIGFMTSVEILVEKVILLIVLGVVLYHKLIKYENLKIKIY